MINAIIIVNKIRDHDQHVKTYEQNKFNEVMAQIKFPSMLAVRMPAKNKARNS